MFGVAATAWQAYRQGRVFVVHYLRRNPTMALCRARTPYHLDPAALPSKAMICDRCRSMRGAP